MYWGDRFVCVGFCVIDVALGIVGCGFIGTGARS